MEINADFYNNLHMYPLFVYYLTIYICNLQDYLTICLYINVSIGIKLLI